MISSHFIVNYLTNHVLCGIHVDLFKYYHKTWSVKPVAQFTSKLATDSCRNAAVVTISHRSQTGEIYVGHINAQNEKCCLDAPIIHFISGDCYQTVAWTDIPSCRSLLDSTNQIVE